MADGGGNPGSYPILVSLGETWLGDHPPAGLAGAQGPGPDSVRPVARYDDEIWRLVPEEPGPPDERLADFVRGIGHVRRALDLGCGDGRLSAELDAGELVAADVSAVALERARSRLPDAELVHLEHDEPLPLTDNDFDLVLCTETIEHVRDVQLFLSEARRVLRPGGELALTTPAHGRLLGSLDPLSPHIRFFTRNSLRDLLEDLGFAIVELERRSGTLFARATR
jgi:SAM-dependent methyltransferase